jgi:hypothetical protein
VLGELRRSGRLGVPCYSSITDLAGLHFWTHPGIDLHFITHPESAEEVEQIAGPGSVRWAKPPTAPSFLAARSRADARRALGLPADGKVVAVSGGGWGVGDLLGATRAALGSQPDAIVLCLCGRNDRLRARVASKLGGDSRLRLMGFTDRMGDVLAASDALIHSSAGLTVLEAIIRGCPVISYGFGYGHVRASNRALERFGLAQVVLAEKEIPAALERALAFRPDPDPSFARRPSTASLILSDERRARQTPAWRRRTARAAVAAGATLAVSAWTLTAGASYSLVSHFVHMRPVTAVQIARPEVGLLVDAPATDVPTIASYLSASGVRGTFALDNPPTSSERSLFAYGDQAIPRLGGGGLVRWLETGDQLHDLSSPLGFGVHQHFVYSSSGPSVGQWWLAHNAGGRLVAGAVRLEDAQDAFKLRAGEVVEMRVSNPSSALDLIDKLRRELLLEHLTAVPVGRLMRDAGVSV